MNTNLDREEVCKREGHRWYNVGTKEEPVIACSGCNAVKDQTTKRNLPRGFRVAGSMRRHHNGQAH